jgi:ATP-dependent Clp protease, protease subunit
MDLMKHFENLQPRLDAPSPGFDDDDDDDDDNEKGDEPAKIQPGPLATLIQKKFLEQRKIFLWGAITDETAKDICERLLYLESGNPGKEITFYMNTPGGSITAGMAIFDTMRLISSPITIVVTGMAASMGSILLCAIPKGRRLLFPHSRVLIHQPLISGRFIGPATDINIQAQEMEKLRAELNQILADASGQPIDKVARDSDRDFYLNAQEAIAYGLGDKIVDKL